MEVSCGRGCFFYTPRREISDKNSALVSVVTENGTPEQDMIKIKLELSEVKLHR